MTLEAQLIEAAKARRNRFSRAVEPPTAPRARTVPVLPSWLHPDRLPMVRSVPRPVPALPKPAADRVVRKRDVLIVSGKRPDLEPDDEFVPRSSWKQIVKEVADKHGVRPSEIISLQRDHRLVIARHEAFYRLKTETRLSLPVIGRLMERDHSTVLYGVRKHLQRVAAGEADPL